MSDRTAEAERERTRDRGSRSNRDSRSDLEFDSDVDIDGLLSDNGGSSGAKRTTDAGDTANTETGASSDPERGGFRERLRERRRGLFSPRVFAIVLALSLAAGFLGGAIPVVGALIGGFAGFLGVFAAAFVVGLVSNERYYAEAGLAGATAAGVTLLVTTLTGFNFVFLDALRDIAPTIGVIGAGAGLLAALVGHYFGRDLHHGLTADVP